MPKPYNLWGPVASVPCYVYDFIVNKKTIDQCKFPRFRYFVVGIALDAIEAQFGCLVDKSAFDSPSRGTAG